MDTPSRAGHVRKGRRRGLGAVALATLIAAGCAAPLSSASPSAPPTGSTPSPSAAATPSASHGTAPTPSISPTAAAAAPSDASAPHWGSAGSMLVGGTSFSAVALADGRALAVYGFWDTSAPSQPRAELWDPGTNAWTSVTGLNKQRTEFVLVGLRDGRALVAGGLNAGGAQSGQSYSSACVFDLRPGHDGCQQVGLMTVARTAPTAVVLPDGRVLVAGGYFNTGWKLASSSGSRGAQPIDAVLAEYRAGPAAAPGASGPGLADVVEDPHGYAMATAEIFDPATGTWATTGAMHYARVGAPATVLSDGRVLVVGSNSGIDMGVTAIADGAYVTAEIYDPRTGRWTVTGRIPAIDHDAIRKAGVAIPDDEGAPGRMGTLVALPSGGAALLDSDRWWKHTADVVRSFRFDPDARSWARVGAACASARNDATGSWDATKGCWSDEETIAVPGGRAVGLGGGPYVATESPQGHDHRSVRLVDAATRQSAQLPPMPGARMAATLIVLSDGSVLVTGGLDADGNYVKEALRLVLA